MSYLAESYERFMVPSLFAPWASYLVQRANPQPGERVLDVACGTGIVARNVAPRVEPQGLVIGHVRRLSGITSRLNGIQAQLSNSHSQMRILTWYYASLD
jgi:tRNA A58 N-methylase Trm61